MSNEEDEAGRAVVPCVQKRMRVARRRLGPALISSFSAHALFIALLAFLAGRAPSSPPREASVDRTAARLVWLAATGEGGGGGGSGNGMKEPPRRSTAPGHDAATVTASPARPSLAPTTLPTDRVEPAVLAPILTIASGFDPLPGTIAAPPSLSSTSMGPGTGGRAGDGAGSGDGGGRGPGVGPGWDGGTGGEAYVPGGDVTMPIEIHKGSPQYTTDAMRARVQGAITVQCVVQPTGVCTNIRVMRSFDPSFGLDQEAIKAASQWRFRPGTRRGQPVPVVVTMEIAFALR
jgi:protein TonB